MVHSPPQYVGDVRCRNTGTTNVPSAENMSWKTLCWRETASGIAVFYVFLEGEKRNVFAGQSPENVNPMRNPTYTPTGVFLSTQMYFYTNYCLYNKPMVTEKEIKVLEDIILNGAERGMGSKISLQGVLHELFYYYQEKAHFQLIEEGEMLEEIEYTKLSHEGQKMVKERMGELWKSNKKMLKGLV